MRPRWRRLPSDLSFLFLHPSLRCRGRREGRSKPDSAGGMGATRQQCSLGPERPERHQDTPVGAAAAIPMGRPLWACGLAAAKRSGCGWRRACAAWTPCPDTLGRAPEAGGAPGSATDGSGQSSPRARSGDSRLTEGALPSCSTARHRGLRLGRPTERRRGLATRSDTLVTAGGASTLCGRKHAIAGGSLQIGLGAASRGHASTAAARNKRQRSKRQRAVQRRAAWPHGHRRSSRYLYRRPAAGFDSVQRLDGTRTRCRSPHRHQWWLAAGYNKRSNAGLVVAVGATAPAARRRSGSVQRRVGTHTRCRSSQRRRRRAASYSERFNAGLRSRTGTVAAGAACAGGSLQTWTRCSVVRGRSHAAAARTAVSGAPQDAQAVRRQVAWPRGHRRSRRHLDRRLATGPGVYSVVGARTRCGCPHTAACGGSPQAQRAVQRRVARPRRLRHS